MRLVVSFALMLMSVSTSATTLLIQSEEDLVRKATDICEGQAISSHSERRGNRIITLMQFNAELCYKSAQKGPITLIWPGGAIQEKNSKGVMEVHSSRVVGMPILPLQEKVILYLERKSSAKPFLVSSWNQGIIELIKDGSSYRLKSAPRLESKASMRLQNTSAPKSLEDYRDHIRKLIQKTK